MIYEELAHHYDALLQDEEATADWAAFVKRYVPQGSLLELACGSGDLAIQLAKLGYAVIATDMSETMQAVAKEKVGQELVHWKQMDMREFQELPQVDGILCFCDSMNYLLEEQEIENVLTQSYQNLKPGGALLFDVHSMDRLDEFTEEYVEDGYLDEVAYQWSIHSEQDYLFQTFAFYDALAKVQVEQHQQRIYDPQVIKKIAMTCGFQVQILTDFTTEGIVEGEKYFYVCRKEVTL